jgi:hypothetical protein
VNVALLLAVLLHRPFGLVLTIYDVAGIDGVAVVEYESQFNDHACRVEPEGTSWGLFQLYSKYHKQYRDDLLLHIVEGASFWAECVDKSACYGALVRHSWDHGGNRMHAFSLEKANGAGKQALERATSNDGTEHKAGGSPVLVGPRHAGNTTPALSLATVYSIYNSGSPTRSLSRGREVERLRDRLARLVAEVEGVTW